MKQTALFLDGLIVIPFSKPTPTTCSDQQIFHISIIYNCHPLVDSVKVKKKSKAIPITGLGGL
jgi:hypothetical protein